MTQYTASSFSQPLRRVYGGFAFGATEKVDMPAPGDLRPARLILTSRDYIWDALYVAPARAVLDISERLNALQFLTIRNYLVLMFGALIALLLDRRRCGLMGDNSRLHAGATRPDVPRAADRAGLTVALCGG